MRAEQLIEILQVTSNSIVLEARAQSLISILDSASNPLVPGRLYQPALGPSAHHGCDSGARGKNDTSADQQNRAPPGRSLLERRSWSRRGRKLHRREDLHEANRLCNTLHRRRFSRRIVGLVVPARQVSDGLASKDLAPLGEAAQPSGDVQRAAAIAARGRDRLSCVEADPDPERQCWFALSPHARAPL